MELHWGKGADYGKYTYIPDPTLAKPGIVDQFTVEVSNAPDERSGLLGAVEGLLHEAAISLGLSQKDTTTMTITLTVEATDKAVKGQYGDLANARYWQGQSFQNCELMAAAIAVNQVNKTQGPPNPNQKSIVALAKDTDSVVKPGFKMFLDETIENQNGSRPGDVPALLNAHTDFGVTATQMSFDPTVAGRSLALTALEASLAQGDAVIVGVNSNLLWSSTGDITKPLYTSAGHAVEVIKVDLTKGTVYVNDSAGVKIVDGKPEGKGQAITIAAFLASWQTSGYGMTIVSAA